MATKQIEHPKRLAFLLLALFVVSIFVWLASLLPRTFDAHLAIENNSEQTIKRITINGQNFDNLAPREVRYVGAWPTVSHFSLHNENYDTGSIMFPVSVTGRSRLLVHQIRDDGIVWETQIARWKR